MVRCVSASFAGDQYAREPNQRLLGQTEILRALRAPESVVSEQELIAKLEENPFSIGYTVQVPSDALKVLLVLYD